MAKEPMSLQEVLATVGKDQTFIVHNLLAQSYNEGFKAGAKDARDAAFKAGFTEGVRQLVVESPAYRAGVTDGVNYAAGLMHECACVALNDVSGFGPVRLIRFSDRLFELFDTTLHPEDLRERLEKIGVDLDAYDRLKE